MPGLLSFVSVSWEFASDYSGCINIGTKSNSDHGKQARKTCSPGLSTFSLGWCEVSYLLVYFCLIIGNRLLGKIE